MRRPAGHLVQLSDEQQINMQVDQLVRMLATMKPGCRVHGKYFDYSDRGGMIVVDAIVYENRPSKPAPAMARRDDPLIAAIGAYRSAVAAFGRAADGAEDEPLSEVFRHQDVLEEWETPASSSAAAIEALRLVLDEMRERFVDGPSVPMIKAVLGFLQSKGGDA